MGERLPRMIARDEERKPGAVEGRSGEMVYAREHGEERLVTSTCGTAMP